MPVDHKAVRTKEGSTLRRSGVWQKELISAQPLLRNEGKKEIRQACHMLRVLSLLSNLPQFGKVPWKKVELENVQLKFTKS